MTLHAHAATRALVVAEILANRWTAPETRPVLHAIRAHLYAAASSLATHEPVVINGITPRDLPSVASEELWKAEGLAEEHPDARLPYGFTHYVLAPLSGRGLPFPDLMHPASERLADKENELRVRLVELHADTEAAAERTARWLTDVFRTWERLTGLSREVAVDNNRPCNRR